MNSVQILEHKIQTFKRKLLLNILLKSVAFFLILFLSTFLILNYLEYFLYLNVFIKTAFFFSFIFLFLFLIIKQIALPIRNYLLYEKSLSNEFAAETIGNHFPDIKDKLLNTIQLQTSNNDSLAFHSVNQRASFFNDFDFNIAIDKEESKKLYYWLIIPFIFLVSTVLYNSNILSVGSQRLLD